MSRFFRNTLIVAFFFGLEKALGFVRQVMVARQFGLSRELDAFNTANNLPDMIFALISGGALAMAFIPVLSEYLQTKGRSDMWDLFSRVGNLVFLVTAAVSILVFIFADFLVRWRLGVAPGFTPEQQVTVVNLMRLNLLATLLFSLSGLVIAGLQANQHFWLPALAPSFFDLGALFGVLILAPSEGYRLGPLTLPGFGLGVYGLVYGTILGAVLFFLVQLPGLVHYKFRWRPILSLRHPGVLQVLSLMGPRGLTVAFLQTGSVAQDNIASRLVPGSVSALVYGWLFMQVPETLIGTSLGTVLLPTISEQATRQEWDAFRQTLNRNVRVLLALTLPVAVLFALGVRPFIGLLGFTAEGADLVVWTVRAYLLGLVGHSWLEVGRRGFYAQQNARTPLITSGLSLVIFVGVAALLAPLLGAPGIALANSLAFTGEAVLLLSLLHRKFGQVLHLERTWLRAGLAALLGGLVVYLAVHFLPVHALLAAVAGLGLGALVALPFLWPELKILVRI